MKRALPARLLRIAVGALVLLAAVGVFGRHRLMAAWLRASAPPARMPAIGTEYPDAGWLPYHKGPFVTTVASMYGPDPARMCKLSGGYQGSCFTPNSAAIIDNLWGADPYTFDTLQMVLGGTEYYKEMYAKRGISSNPYFESTAADPQYHVVCDAAGFPASCDRGSVRIPAGAVPETSGDHHLFIRDLTSGEDWQSWGAPIPGSDPFAPRTANSVKYADSEGIAMGGTAGNISTAWSVRPQDIIAGRIPHALMIRVTCDTTFDGKHGGYVYPVLPNRSGNATDNDFFCGTSGANGRYVQQWRPNTDSIVNLNYGAHLWSDVPDADLPKATADGANGCDPIARAELRALNEFGAYVTDVGTAEYFKGPIFVDHMADISDTYTGNPHGTHSYWQDLLQPLTGEVANSRLYYSLKDCGVNLAKHLHVLVPPARN